MDLRLHFSCVKKIVSRWNQDQIVYQQYVEEENFKIFALEHKLACYENVNKLNRSCFNPHNVLRKMWLPREINFWNSALATPNHCKTNLRILLMMSFKTVISFSESDTVDYKLLDCWRINRRRRGAAILYCFGIQVTDVICGCKLNIQLLYKTPAWTPHYRPPWTTQHRGFL